MLRRGLLDTAAGTSTRQVDVSPPIRFFLRTPLATFILQHQKRPGELLKLMPYWVFGETCLILVYGRNSTSYISNIWIKTT